MGASSANTIFTCANCSQTLDDQVGRFRLPNDQYKHEVQVGFQPVVDCRCYALGPAATVLASVWSANFLKFS